MATIGEILRVALHYSQQGGGDIMNVFHFIIEDASVPDTLIKDDVELWIADEWGARWALMASSGVVLLSFEADIVAIDGTVTRNIGGGIVDTAGTVGGEPLPAGCAGYLLAYTAIPKARGSKYVPGITESEQSGGELVAGYLADLALLLAVYLTPYAGSSGATLRPGVVSKVLATFVPFLVSGAIDTLVAYQRRRKVGVGI